MDAPTVAAITLDEAGGGIAAVSRLLWDVVRDHWGASARLLTIFDRPGSRATFAEKARYAVALTQAQVCGHTDWILFTHLGLAKVQRAVPLRARRPYAVFLHGIEAWNGLSAAEAKVLTRADVRIANSKYTAERVMRAHPSIGPVEACPLALPPHDTQRSSVLPWSLGPHVVLVVGRMNRSERYKGHDELIVAWPRVVARVPDAQLVIVGAGDDEKRLRRAGVDSGAGDRILFTGFVASSDLDALYQRAALFALPSRGEGFGLVYLEAMRHRLPCIGSVHDAAREVIVDGVTGSLVGQEDPAALADAITSLLLDPERRKRTGDAGHLRLVSEFSFERFRSRMGELLAGRDGAAASVGR